MNEEKHLLIEDDYSQNINQENSPNKKQVENNEEDLNLDKELYDTDLNTIEIDYGRTSDEEEKINIERNTKQFQEGFNELIPKKLENRDLNQDKNINSFKNELLKQEKEEEGIKESPDLMHTLLKPKNKRFGNREIYLVNRGDIGSVANLISGKEKLPELKKDKTKKLKNKSHRLELLGTQQNYYLVKFYELEIFEYQINSKPFYGYVHKNDVEEMATYKEIEPTRQKRSKEGKILPDKNDPPISHKDVYQAGIGDCYLHAALIALVNANPKLIIDLFEIKKDRVIVTFPGYTQLGRVIQPMKISMSKKLFFNSDGNPLYGGKKEGYLWAAFLEKAWAIKEGGYANISGGKAINIINMLTGKVASLMYMAHIENEWELYNQIVTALNTNQPVTLGTNKWTDKGGIFNKKRVKPSKKKHSGLGISHVYGVLSISNNKLSKESNVKNELLKVTIELRDPRTRNGKTTKLSFKDMFGKENKHIQEFTFGNKKDDSLFK